MQWAVSDLAFGGFNKKYLSGLPLTYNIEFFMNSGPTIIGIRYCCRWLRIIRKKEHFLSMVPVLL